MVEEQIINRVLATKDIDWLRNRSITKSDFHVRKDEIEYIYDFVNRYKNVPDKETFIDKFNEFPIMEVTDSEVSLIDRLIEESIAYRTMPALKDVASDINNFNSTDGLKKLKQFVDDVPTYSGQPIVMMDNALKDIEESDPVEMIETSFESVYLRSDDAFMSIIAGTGIGKTWVLCKIAVDMARDGKRVLFISEELSQRAVTERLYAYYRHVPVSDVMEKSCNIRFSDISLQIGILDHSMARYTYVSDVEDAIRSFKPDVVLIDDVSYMSPNIKDDQLSRMKPYERISESIYQLMILQHTTCIPMITSMQFNRTGGSAQIKSLYDVSGSIDSVTKAPTVVLLDRKKDKKDTIYMIVDKDRYSDEGRRILRYEIDYSTCTWTYDGLANDDELSVDDICDKAMNRNNDSEDNGKTDSEEPKTWRNRKTYFTNQDVVDGKADEFEYIRGNYPDGKYVSAPPEKIRNKLIKQFGYEVKTPF